MNTVVVVIFAVAATIWFFCDYVRTGHEVYLIFGICGIVSIVWNVVGYAVSHRPLKVPDLVDDPHGDDNDG